MQCSRCGAPVQQGMAFCPNCGTPYPSAQNAPGSAPIPPTQYAGPSSFDPTVAAPPYNPGNAGQAFPPAGSSPSQPGYSNYNSPPAYQAPSSYNASSGYGTPPPPSPNAYNEQNAYGTPPPPPNLYGAPYAPAPAPGAFTPPGQPPRKKGPNVGLIIGIVVLLVVIVVGGVMALRGINHNGGQTNAGTPGVTTTTTSNTTPTTGTTTTASPTAASNSTPSPSGSPIDTGAAAIITNVQTSSAIDANYLPTHVTDQFTVGSVVYVTYRLNLTQSGYVEAKVYADGVFGTQTSLQVTVGKYDHGYFNITYKQAGTGAFELYWCLQKDCSDEKLAAVATFTVA